jgi:predicted  nucleic acid-binding Zn-ribbon protein
MVKERYASYCTKCGNNFEGKPKTCPECGNKAYLRSQVILPNAIVITERNRPQLEYHCRCIIPKDVLSIVPSAIAMQIGAEEEEELAKERALKYEKIREAKKTKNTTTKRKTKTK